jgi:hypothetical protein
MSDILAIAGGSPVRPTEYPKWPVIDADDEAIVLEALRSGRWGGYPEPGPYNARFCADFAKFQGSTHGRSSYQLLLLQQLPMRRWQPAHYP